MDPKESIGQRIKAIRVNRNETLEEFARSIRMKTDSKVKTNKSNVSKWEKGLNVPNDITLKAIADLGGISQNFLLEGSFPLKNIKDLSTPEKEQYKKEMENYTTFKAIEKLGTFSDDKFNISSYQEARFIKEVITFMDNCKKDSNNIDKDILLTAAKIFGVLNLQYNEFTHEKFTKEFKLSRLESDKNRYKNYTEQLYDNYTTHLKDNYL